MAFWHPWEPGWQSEAYCEVRNGERRPAGGAWGEAPVRTAYAAAAVFLFAALDCLSPMAHSVTLLTTAYVPNVQGRAAMEAGSQAWWPLETGIGARRRVIRSVLIRAQSARFLGQAVRRVDPALTVTDYGEDPRRPAVCDWFGPDLHLHRPRVECEAKSCRVHQARHGV